MIMECEKQKVVLLECIHTVSGLCIKIDSIHSTSISPPGSFRSVHSVFYGSVRPSMTHMSVLSCESGIFFVLGRAFVRSFVRSYDIFVYFLLFILLYSTISSFCNQSSENLELAHSMR